MASRARAAAATRPSEPACHRVEQAAQPRAQRRNRGDNDYCHEASDEGVFDRRHPALVAEKSKKRSIRRGLQSDIPLDLGGIRLQMFPATVSRICSLQLIE
jgi:hypothetical protein